MRAITRKGAGGKARALAAALLLPLFLSVSASAADTAALLAAGSAKWGLKASRELTSELTDGRLAGIAARYGAEKGEALRAKRDAVAGLLLRYRSGRLLGGDLGTADAHLDRDFRDEIYGLFSLTGTPAPVTLPDASRLRLSPPQLERLSELIRQGKLSGDELSALYDGCASGGEAAAVRAMPAGQAAPALSQLPVRAAPAPALRPSAVPALVRDRPAPGGKYVRPPMPDIKEIGRANMAVSRWDARRRELLAAYKRSDGGEKLGAAAALSGAVLMQGLLVLSGLPQVETATARLAWDTGHGAPPGVIAADAAKLAFHTAAVMITFLPVPIVQITNAALAGNPAAIAFLLAVAAGPANRFILHLID